jgi:(p)ppGpp synthase/HD superfamily hydrolase
VIVLKAVPRIAQAYIFAYKAHSGKHRKDSTIPYIVHPMDVASVLMKNGASEDVVIAGLLHDVVEDACVELKELKELFGCEVARLVDGASEPEKYRGEMPREKRRATWKERKSHTINSVKTADLDLKLLSCADKLSNIRDMIDDYNEIEDKLWNKLNASKEDNAWYYRSMLASFQFAPNSLIGKPIFHQFRNSVEALYGLS